MPKILTQDPDRSSQICGDQIEYGNGRASRYCGAPKAPGLYFCREHHDQSLAEYGEIRMAPGNAIGR